MSRRHNLNTFRRAAAPAPAAPGHRPLLLAMALAAGFSPLPARAQPAGAQAVVGSASLAQQGSKLVVTTQNGPGSNFSSIHWQSFNVPAGTTTHFAQPGATSTSINRVIGPDPSAIFGTLSSNGRLVLVNPAGITVGAGAVVDTAAFTASTLRMSDADALSGRLRFAGGDGAALRVDGQVLARQGDVVLIGQNVQTGAQALVRSPQGATILAAGQKVEVTGRGLEGIFLEVQAPADQALNLGTLRGDAVGVFAGTLKHSGVVQAQAVSTEGGKVVLRAADLAQVAGTVRAQGLGGAGGGVDVLGGKVGVLAGARIDTSNTGGGGRIRIGGDYQGGNAAVPNAQVAYVDRDAQLRANATLAGDGGRVTVWSDDTTRAWGSIEAKAGPQGGDGGFVETSGKRYLDTNGIRVNASAAQGAAGTWLLDPTDIVITNVAPVPAPSAAPLPILDLVGSLFSSASNAGASYVLDSTLNTALNGGTSVAVSTSSTGGGNGDISFDGTVALQRTAVGAATLTLNADRDIVFKSGSTTTIQALTTPPPPTASPAPAGPRSLDVILNAGSGIVRSESGASVQLSTNDNAHAASITLANGATWFNDGTLTLNLNGKLNLDNGSTGATFANTGTVNGAAGATGGVGGVATTPLGRFANDGTVNLTQGAFRVGNFTQSSGSFTLDSAFSATSLGVGGGSLSITQTAGNLDLTGGAIATAGGNVFLKANAGAIDFSSIDTGVHGGSLSAAGGSLALDAFGNISGGSLAADGYRGFGSGTGGSAGSVTVVSANGSVSLADVSARGADGSSGSGGNGNAIAITAPGSITVTGGIGSTGGGGSLGAGGSGGAVTLSSSGGAIGVWGGIDASGGSSSSLTGGRGGAVNVTGESIDLGYVDNTGGYGGAGGKGGDAAAISLIANSGLVVGTLYAMGGSGGYDTAQGGTGGNGGAGGGITLVLKNGTLDLSDGGIYANGGDGGSGGSIGGSGGAGGKLTVTTLNGGVTTAPIDPFSESSSLVDTSGGWGGDSIGPAGTDHGGNGGNAGSITFNVSGPTTLLSELVASGGGGGWTDSGNARAGNGGDGAAVAINASGSAGVQLGGGIYAGGGDAGVAGTYDAVSGTYGTDAARGGTGGRTGSFTTNAAGGISIGTAYATPTLGANSQTDLTSLNVEAQWTNNATVVMQPGAWVLATQPLTNNGTIDLGAGSILSLGSYDQAADTFTPGNLALTNAAGAVLRGIGTVEGSVINAGTLQVGDTATYPASPVGVFSVAGNFEQQASGKLVFDVAANMLHMPGQSYDLLKVSGTAALDGQLVVNPVPEITVPPAPTTTPAPTPAPPVLALATASAGALASPTDGLVLIDAAGGITGSFQSLASPASYVPSLQAYSAGVLIPMPGAVLPPPAPAVIPTDSLADKITGLLNGSTTLGQIEAALAEQDNLVTKFLDKLLDEDDKHKDAAKGEVVYTDTACKPS